MGTPPLFVMRRDGLDAGRRRRAGPLRTNRKLTSRRYAHVFVRVTLPQTCVLCAPVHMKTVLDRLCKQRTHPWELVSCNRNVTVARSRRAMA